MSELIIYWIASTIYGIYYFIKKSNYFKSKDEFSLLNIICCIAVIMLIAPFVIPLYLLSLIKFKRAK
jgi:uncharacterized membrane protein YidH (DUF202 family)